MLHIILLILKIIAIILLSVLGLLLFLILIVLLVPIRYRVTAGFGEKLDLEGRAGWLFHILHANVKVTDGKQHIKLHIFGFVIYDSLHSKKDRRKRGGSGRTAQRVKEREAPDSPPRHAKIPTEDGKEAQIARIPTEDRKETVMDRGTYSEITSRLSEEPGTSEGIHDEDSGPESGREEGRNENIFRKILRKIKGFYHGIIRFFVRLKEKLKHLFSTLLSVKHKVGLILDFLKDEINKKAFRISYASLIKLLKHILPVKFKAHVTFGTGDPCSTGKALGLFGFLYGFYGEHVSITPDFENKVLEGNLYARGRIRLFTILIIVIKLLLDKKVKQLVKNYKILKEALS